MSKRLRPTAILLVIVAALAITAGAANGASPQLGQPISITWTKGFTPPAFYEYQQELTYRFTVTNNSDQLHFANVVVTEYIQPAKVGPTSMKHWSYKLQPHSHINVIYKTYAPDGSVFADATFGVSPSVQAEGYPSVWLGSYAWHDSGK